MERKIVLRLGELERTAKVRCDGNVNEAKWTDEKAELNWSQVEPFSIFFLYLLYIIAVVSRRLVIIRQNSKVI